MHFEVQIFKINSPLHLFISERGNQNKFWRIPQVIEKFRQQHSGYCRICGRRTPVNYNRRFHHLGRRAASKKVCNSPHAIRTSAPVVPKQYLQLELWLRSWVVRACGCRKSSMVCWRWPSICRADSSRKTTRKRQHVSRLWSFLSKSLLMMWWRFCSINSFPIIFFFSLACF